MFRQNIIFDTDPGIDDCIALNVLFHLVPENVKAIVTTYGNMPLFRTTNNALTVLEELGWQVPVIVGAREDENRYKNSDYIHGADGLGGLGKTYPGTVIPDDRFEDRLYDTVKALKKVCYVAVGPLTNLARLLQKHPDAADYLETVSVMGGGLQMGNVTPHAEFNIHCDPESADYVFTHLPRIILSPLNVTTRIFYDFDEIDRFLATGRTSAFNASVLRSGCRACKQYGEPGAVMHDSTAVIALLKPYLFHFRKTGIRVLSEGERFGETVAAPGDNVLLVTDADAQKVLRCISGCLK